MSLSLSDVMARHMCYIGTTTYTCYVMYLKKHVQSKCIYLQCYDFCRNNTLCNSFQFFNEFTSTNQSVFVYTGETFNQSIDRSIDHFMKYLPFPKQTLQLDINALFFRFLSTIQNNNLLYPQISSG